MRKAAILSATMMMVAVPAIAADAVPSAHDILLKSVAIPTVEGRGKVPELAAYYTSVLKAAGYADSDIVFTPVGETGILAVTLKGRTTGKPILLNGHMDVVEARAADWTRDPFVPVEEHGYVFGRGAEDNKYDVAVMVAAMAQLKAQGYRPKQDVILVLTGDEETHMLTAAAAAKTYGNAEMLLNGDGGGGLLGDDGKPVMYLFQAGEKTYADFTVTLTDAGGHSSAPTPGNPIYRMGRILAKLDAYDFPPQQNALTRATLTLAAQGMHGPMTEAIHAFLANPQDGAAADRISTAPELIGQIRTTCTATMMDGGHALNALPQRATLNINCRIFPGVSVESVQATLVKVIDDKSATMAVVDAPLASDASPLRTDVVNAVTSAVQARYPGLKVVPSMSAGATDSLYFRAVGVPSYGIASLFMKPSDGFAHGLNERVPSGDMVAAQGQWVSVVKALTK